MLFSSFLVPLHQRRFAHATTPDHRSASIVGRRSKIIPTDHIHVVLSLQRSTPNATASVRRPSRVAARACKWQTGRAAWACEAQASKVLTVFAKMVIVAGLDEKFSTIRSPCNYYNEQLILNDPKRLEPTWNYLIL